MDTQTVSDAIDPRDGPTEEFRRHHEVITRAGTSTGRRVRTRLERMLLEGDIAPAQSEAGRRFAWSYAVGCNPGVRSCLAASLSGGRGDGGFTDNRHQAFVAYDEARRALDGGINPQAVVSAPSNVLTKFCVDDASFSEIAEELGLRDATVKRWIRRYLETLAEHYAGVDRRLGRTATAETVEMALRRFEPLDAADEKDRERTNARKI